MQHADTIHDLYTFKAKHGIEMRDALARAGLGPNWASRVRTGKTKKPNPKSLQKLADALYEIAIENGTMPADITSVEAARQIGSGQLVRGEIASIRESLARIESVAGGERG